MAYYKAPISPVMRKFFAPVAEAYPGSSRHRRCTVLGGLDFIERKRKSKREEEAKGAGAGYVATAIERFTLRSVKFVRWLRNFLYSEAPWSHAIARLAKVYSTW